jgi:hypothetical protein
MYCYVYKNPKGELFMSTLRDTGVDAMRAYLCMSTTTDPKVVYDLFETAKLRGGKIVEVEIRETGR